MCNFANKMQGVREKATLWYSRGGGLNEVYMQLFVMGVFNFDFVDLQSTTWPVPLDNA